MAKIPPARAVPCKLAVPVIDDVGIWHALAHGFQGAWCGLDGMEGIDGFPHACRLQWIRVVDWQASGRAPRGVHIHLPVVCIKGC